MVAIIPKNIESGKKINLRLGKKGECFVTLEILNEEQDLSEKLEFIIDTGFNGFLQLQEKTISKLKLRILNEATCKGFDGTNARIGLTKTKIKLLNASMWNFPIQVVKIGPNLIGTCFLIALKAMIIIDYRNKKITLTGDKKVQKKTHKAVDKYAE